MKPTKRYTPDCPEVVRQMITRRRRTALFRSTIFGLLTFCELAQSILFWRYADQPGCLLFGISNLTTVIIFAGVALDFWRDARKFTRR